MDILADKGRYIIDLRIKVLSCGCIVFLSYLFDDIVALTTSKVRELMGVLLSFYFEWAAEIPFQLLLPILELLYYLLEF